MLYLVKIQRCAGNHQYIEGIYKDEDIAHFMGEYHQKFERGGHKYHYIVEPISWVDESCFIVSWENNDETMTYRIYMDEEHYKLNLVKGTHKNYRFEAREYVPDDYDIADDDLEHCADYWHFFEGKELLGLHKVYKAYKDRKYEERKKRS